MVSTEVNNRSLNSYTLFHSWQTFEHKLTTKGLWPSRLPDSKPLNFQWYSAISKNPHTLDELCTNITDIVQNFDKYVAEQILCWLISTRWLSKISTCFVTSLTELLNEQFNKHRSVHNITHSLQLLINAIESTFKWNTLLCFCIILDDWLFKYHFYILLLESFKNTMIICSTRGNTMWPKQRHLYLFHWLFCWNHTLSLHRHCLNISFSIFGMGQDRIHGGGRLIRWIPFLLPSTTLVPNKVIFQHHQMYLRRRYELDTTCMVVALIYS